MSETAIHTEDDPTLVMDPALQERVTQALLRVDPNLDSEAISRILADRNFTPYTRTPVPPVPTTPDNPTVSPTPPTPPETPPPADNGGGEPPEQNPPGRRDPEPQPRDEQPDLKKLLTVQNVDLSHGVISEAGDSSDERIAEKSNKRGLRNILKRIWYGNVAKDYYKQKYDREGRQQIVAEQNVYALKRGSSAQDKAAKEAVVTRFTSEFLHSGESNAEITSMEGGTELETGIKVLILACARGDLDYDAVEQEKVRLVSLFGNIQHGTNRNKGLMYADNVIQVAKNARAAFEHGVGIDAIEQAISLKSGEAKLGARTEVHKTAVDKAVDKLYSTKAGSLVNEATIGAVSAVALGFAKLTSRKALTALTASVSMGVGAGIFAGIRESFHIKQERKTHLRDRAVGGQIEEGSKRREQLEATRYETVTANSLIEQLAAASEAHQQNLGLGTIRRFINNISEVDTRIRLSDDMSIDLIDFESRTSVEQQRLDLDIALAKAKVEVLSLVDGLTDEQRISLFNTAERSGIDAVIAERRAITHDMLMGDVTAKDQVFSKLRRNQVAKAAVLGFTTGMVFGEASQELRGLVSNSLQGVFEGHHAGQDRRTLLAGLFRDQILTSSHTKEAPGVGYTFHHGNATIDLPKGFDVIHSDKTGLYELKNPGGHVVGDIDFNRNGGLTAASSALLEKHGFKLKPTLTETTKPHIEYRGVEVGGSNYVNEYPERFTAIDRQLWYDNNTPYSDYNELRGYWGNNGTGIDQHGNYSFNVSYMTANGSFEGDQAANAPQLIANHELYIALSVTKETQGHVILVPVDKNGVATFDKSDALFSKLFEDNHGQAEYNGAYLEVVELVNGHELPTTLAGDHSRPVQMRMLATLAGNNHVKAVHKEVPYVIHERASNTVTKIEAPVAIPERYDLPTEVAPVIPIYARRGLESLAETPNLTNPNLAPMYYGGHSLEELREWITRDPSLLHTRKEVNEDGVKKWVEADGSEVVRSVDRERQELQKYIEEQKASNAEHMSFVERVSQSLGSMGNKNRVSVNIPAWMEGDNLRKLLDEYAQQFDAEGTEIDPELYEVNILVNRKTGTEPDNSAQVIDQFINDFKERHGRQPKVNYADVEIDPPHNNVGYARKLLTDAVVLRSLGRDSQSEPLYIETEDADVLTVDKRTIYNVINKFDTTPYLDAVTGVQDRTPAYMKDNDYLFLRRRAVDFIVTAARNRKYRDPNHPNWNFTWNRIVTNGWNTAYSAESYALIGGYDSVVAGEDMSVGERISMIRGDGQTPNLEVIGRVSSRSNSSPRRFIQEIKANKLAYEDFANEEDNQTIRETSVEDAMRSIAAYSRIDASNETVFTDYIKSLYSWAQSMTPTNRDAMQLTKRMLFFLGFKKDDYRIAEDGFEILSWDNVKTSLEKYRDRFEAGNLPVAALAS